MQRLKLFIPLALFALMGVFLWRGLSLDPTALPSARVGTPVPAFVLPQLNSDAELTEQALTGEPLLLNVWATWCYSCRVEHPYLLELAANGVKIVGLNYKDESDKAIRWLDELGDPYAFTIADTEGKFGLDLGVYGAPETYVISAEGVVVHRHVGVVDDAVWRNDLAPFFSSGEPQTP
jgi:cytochrome c biogenesis protein CcmG/thiol:disulfide interchange protein DsbE